MSFTVIDNCKAEFHINIISSVADNKDAVFEKSIEQAKFLHDYRL